MYMRLSTLAALMILTTIMLSACSQEQVAAVIDNSNGFYGQQGAYPRYSSWNPAPNNPQVDYKYQNSDAYAVEAEVGSVSSQDLAPPPQATPAQQPVAAPEPQITPAPSIAASDSIIETASAMQWQWPTYGKVMPNADHAGKGVVIAAPEGMPIRAAGEGEVAYIGKDLSDFGNIVIVRHRDGVMTSYANAREILVAQGDHIRQGDLLGYVGKTGNAKSPQLLFSMQVADASVDPLQYLPRNVASR
jgi:murein DD-endopeptidase MepM/ murein hydrolase activator NlpD